MHCDYLMVWSDHFMNIVLFHLLRQFLMKGNPRERSDPFIKRDLGCKECQELHYVAAPVVVRLMVFI